MKKTKYKIRIAPLVMAIVLMFQVFYPTAALAVTSGAGQPETQSFEPVGTTQLVDPFSGDFNYNIPLLTVPGPNGGYPVNLAYHAGITPEQEASWVGLGWNVNAGSVNRGMRGLPDDFFGSDIVKKQQTVKPNWIFGLNGGVNLEACGFELPEGVDIGVGVGLSYNNYKGLNVTADIKSLIEYKNERISDKKQLNVGFDVSFNAQEGPDVHVDATIKDVEDKGEEGKDNLLKKLKKGQETMDAAQSRREFTFSNDNPSFSPNASFPEGGFDASLWVKFGAEVYQTFPDAMVKGFLFFQHIKDKTLDFPSYGYMYSGERNRVDAGLSPYMNYPGAPAVSAQVREGMALMDFHRDNHGVNTYAPNLPVPLHTFDVFSASAQGLGMVFRPHRNDVGILYDSRNTSDFTDIELGLELGLGNLVHTGLNPGVSYSSTYSGKWKGQYKDFEKEFEFTNNIYNTNDQMSDDNASVFKDPFFFKSSGDKTVSETDLGKFRNDDKVNFEITSIMDLLSGSVFSDFDPSKYSLSIRPKIKNQLPGTTTKVLTGNKNQGTDARDNSIQYKSRFEIVNTVASNTSPLVNHLYNTNEFPGITPGALGNPIDYSLTADKKGHHIAEYSIVNPDGNIYVFGLPTYNLKEKEAVFSIANDNTFNRKVSYNPVSEGSMSNSQGIDNLYSSTEMPAFSTSHLLTAIYSADYVDITGNGPSDDDFGYYVKFNYSTITSTSKYKWRVPFCGAAKIENYVDNDADDKAFYKYGEKEIYYLNSIETKTHLAAFELNNESTNKRYDAYGTLLEHASNASLPQPDNALPLRYLDKIKLYSKANPNVAIKTVHFEYDYSLCPNTINSVFNSALNPTKGKLTLKKVFFTYLNNDKGALSPYEFTYDSFNPSYQEMLSDRWGNYKEDVSVSGSGVNYLADDFPYVDQDKVKADKFAAAWSLKEVKMPSGGKLKVEYESDTYQYVQNKKAMQMFEIKGTGYIDDPSNAIMHSGFDIDREPGFGELHDLLFFDLKTPTANPTDLAKYIEGIDKYFYFKASVRLKDRPSSNDKAYDYVEGYARLNKPFGVQFDPASLTVIGSNTVYTRACIKVDFQKSVTLSFGDDGKLHPFRKAAFEYMKLRRPELFFPLNGTSSTSGLSHQVLSTIINMVSNLGQLLTSYNRWCKLMGYGDKLADGTDGNPTANDEKKSYIRLNTPDGVKYGGGHRVKKILMDNQWNLSNPNATTEYGQEYNYHTPDGKSSGVAEYEPHDGGEENPHKIPEDDYMSDRTFVARLKELYQDKPMCETYYPGPNVGYSRVAVKSLTRDLGSGEINKLSASGITVNEFFTANDFPVIEESAGTDNTSFDQGVTIPFIGKLSLTTSGFSQGYKVTLNDMHGKPKAIRVYPHNTNFSTSSQPIHEVEYTYSLNNNNLNNKVTGLFNDGIYRDIEIGVDRDFVMDMNQNSQFTIDLGLATNVDVSLIPPLPLVTVSLIPYLNYSHNTFRTFVNVKSVYRQGILMETKTKNDGAITVAKNLMFDAYSGRPVLTQVNNEFKEPIYTYDMPAHWYYNNMGNKSLYYKYSSACSYVSSGPGIAITHGSYFNIGDKVSLSVQNSNTTVYKNYWIRSVTGTGVFVLADEKGILYTGSPSYNLVTLVDPIKKNLLTTNAGQIVSLTNPVTDVSTNFFTSFNFFLSALTGPPPTSGSFLYKECIEPLVHSVTFNYNTLTNEINFLIDGGCRVSLKMPPSVNVTNYNNYNYFKGGGSVVSIKDIVLGSTLFETAILNDPAGCVSTCLDGVLHAEAFRFKDDWTYDYADMGDPFAYLVGSSTIPVSSAVAQNQFKYGKKGIWRMNEKYLYQVDRQQASPQTDISKDGTYQVFNLHNWVAPGNSGTNKQWSQNFEITKYNPHGFGVESRNWFSLFSSALYGNDNKVALAVGNNCPYDQLSGQSFENSASGTLIKAGHISIVDQAAGALTVTNSESHSGFRALQFGGKTIQINNLMYSTTSSISGVNYHLVPGQKYILTAWVKNNSNTSLPIVTGPAALTSVNFSKNVVDGWKRMEVEFSFSTLANNTVYSININAAGISNMLIDDIRIQPFNSTVKTFVYNPITLNLMAEMDDKNYATFYTYDETGAIVQTKRETEMGIYSVKNVHSNIKRN